MIRLEILRFKGIIFNTNIYNMKLRVFVLVLFLIAIAKGSMMAQPNIGDPGYQEFPAFVDASVFPCPTVITGTIKKCSRSCINNADVLVERTSNPSPCPADFLRVRLDGPSYGFHYDYLGIAMNTWGPSQFYDLLNAGSYTLTITYYRYIPGPGGGHIALIPSITNFTIDNFCAPISISCPDSDELCNPGNNGSITTTFSQSSNFSPYAVELKKGSSVESTFSTGSSPVVFPNLVAASYTVKITDSYGTSATCSTTVGLTNNVVITPIDINIPPYVCLHTPPFSLINSVTTGGTFSGPGVGVSTNIFTAKNAGEGLHTILYSKTASRSECNITNVPVKILVQKSPPYINRVISATSAPMNDQWPNDFTDANTSTTIPGNLINSHMFNSGSKGIWRTEESYVYIEDRKQRRPTSVNPNVNIRLDGIYDTLPLFFYNIGDMAGCYPRWRKMNTITKYNPYSNETENKDVLNRRSSALYGYKGDLSTAVAINSAETEIAYNGFEEFSAGDSLTPLKMGPGNLTVFTYAPSSFSNQLFDEYQVLSAVDNILTLNATSAAFSDLLGKTVKVFGAGMNAYDAKNTILGSSSVTAVDATNKTITLSTLSGVGVWKGKISVLQNYAVKQSYSLATVSVVTTTASYPAPKFRAAHTGKNSLSVTGRLESELYKLRVNSDRNYVVSAWVLSTNPLDTFTYKSSVGAVQKRGIKLKFYAANGTSITPSESAVIEPSGLILEGWQKLEGTIDIPAGTVRISLLLNDGGTTTLFDDIRVFPETGNIQTYAYNKDNYKVNAVLDNNNYATFYYYDEQGNLFLIKKETEKGIKTIQESFSHQQE
jgi:hypothetical protein